MTDPFDALRSAARAVDPDPDFAATLREQLRHAVLNGGEMPSTTEAPARAEVRALTPYLAVTDARRAVDFYVEVFGAVRRADPIVMDDGRVGHVEVAIGDSVLMLAEQFPEMGNVVAPEGGAVMRVEVSDVDTAMAKAVELGAELVRPAEDGGYGKHGTVKDPYGQRWLVAQAEERPAPEAPPIPHGQAGYFTFQVPEAEPAKAFYGAVLGWRFSPGFVEGGWGIDGHGLEGGLWGGPGRQVGFKVMFAVDDLEAALAHVTAEGGQAGEVETMPYGLSADCTDNQGIEFWLWQQPAE